VNKIHATDNTVGSILVVGHNPAITDVAKHFVGEKVSNIVPAGLAIIEFESSDWRESAKESGQLLHYINPENL
jgi:phosphohistidine phosphatase